MYKAFHELQSDPSLISLTATGERIFCAGYLKRRPRLASTMTPITIRKRAWPGFAGITEYFDLSR
jgi:hypothetical protein